MTRNLIILFFLLLLTNCGISGSAFLGPAYTGVKTGSVYQTSLSYSSGKIVNQLKENDLIKKSKNIDTFLKSTEGYKYYIIAEDDIKPLLEGAASREAN